MDAISTPAPYLWNGIWKLSEECAEVCVVIGKLGPFPTGDHPDGAGPLRERLEDEIADVRAASRYVIAANGLNEERIAKRAGVKYKQFCNWGLTGVGDFSEPEAKT